MKTFFRLAGVICSWVAALGLIGAAVCEAMERELIVGDVIRGYLKKLRHGDTLKYRARTIPGARSE
jgi:hypothetical protein